MGAKKGATYRTKEDMEYIHQYYLQYGEFPENLSRFDKRNLKVKWARTSALRGLASPNMSNFNGYTGKPCVYVRQLEGDSFYIGRTKNLYKRYPYKHEASQIIYFEEYDSNEDTYAREYELMREFAQCNLPLSNEVGLKDKPRRKKSNSLQYTWW